MERKKKNLVILLIALFLGYTMVYIDKMSVAYSLIPIAEEWGVGPEVKGGIMSAFFLGYALMQVPMGFAINKFGSRIILIGSVVGIGIFALCFGFGTSIILLMGIRFLTGLIAHSGYASSASKEVSMNIPLEKRTFAQGILISSSGVAGVVGPLLLSPIITNYGWRAAYQLLTVLSMVIAGIMVFAIPKEEKLSQDTFKKDSVSLKVVWLDKRVWVLFFAAFFINNILYGSINWMPSFLTEQAGLTLNKAASVNSIAGIFSLIGAIGGSYIVGKFFHNKEKLVVSVTGVLGTIALFSVYFVSSVLLITLLMGLANFLLTITFVSLMSIPLKIFSGAIFAPSYATLATGGIVGGFVSPMLIGFLIKLSNGSYITTFMFFLIMGILTTMTILTLSTHTKEELEK